MYICRNTSRIILTLRNISNAVLSVFGYIELHVIQYIQIQKKKKSMTAAAIVCFIEQ